MSFSKYRHVVLPLLASFVALGVGCDADWASDVYWAEVPPSLGEPLGGGVGGAGPGTCSNGMFDGDESYTDCGGACAVTLAGRCFNFKPCNTDSDCRSNVCDNSSCAPCSSSADCNDGDYCFLDWGVQDAYCKPQMDVGAWCGSNGTGDLCLSDQCASGYCCDSACDDGCGSCSEAGSEGSCVPAKCITACDSDDDCSASFTCQAGKCHPLQSCKDILAAYPGAADGVYWLDPDGVGPASAFEAYCDMTTHGGGWTLGMKVDGRSPVLRHNSSLWLNAELLNSASLDLSEENAKLRSWNQVLFEELLVGMRESSNTAATMSYRILPLSPQSSLYGLFLPDQFIPTNLGRTSWLSMVPGAYIQPNCNREGINNNQPWGFVRIGISGNNENSCVTADSYFGLGGRTHSACWGYADQPGAGSASCYPKARKQAFGILLVR